MKFVSGRYVATIALLTLTVGAWALTLRRPSDQLAQPLTSVGTDIAGWRMTGEDALPPNIFKRLAVTSYLSRTYQRNNNDLGLFIAYYAQQRAGESMHSPKHCLPGAGWDIWKHDAAEVQVGNDRIKVNKYSISNSGHRMVMLYWYQNRQRIIASEYAGKLFLMKDTFLDGRTAGSLVRISVKDDPAAVADAIAFASELIPRLRLCFGTAGGV